VEEQSRAGEQMAVLLADDDRTVRRVGERMLQKMGYEVVVAADGVEAVALFAQRRGRFGCVLLDLTMPRMDGVEALRELRRICPDVCVLLSSGYGEIDVKERFGDYGFAGFIQKPYRYAELQQVLARALKRTEK
jgi:two-component system cell cycle sensor histidine kinase/response regulator CckA